MLDELVDQFGEAAIITPRTYVLDDGETFRWVVQSDGWPCTVQMCVSTLTQATTTQW